MSILCTFFLNILHQSVILNNQCYGSVGEDGGHELSNAMAITLVCIWTRISSKVQDDEALGSIRDTWYCF